MCAHWALSLSCPDRSGIVHSVTGALASLDGNITDSQQFGDPISGRFFMRVEVLCDRPRAQIESAIAGLATGFEMQWLVEELGRPMPTIIMVSKSAHCLNDLLFRQRQENLPIDVKAVVSNHQDLQPLADFYSVPFHYIPITPDTKEEAESRLTDLVDELHVELVVLARYMQILSDPLTRSLEGKIINIHHSFLPSFKGAKPYHQAYERGVKLIGATAHYVTADLDEGPIIEQVVQRVDHRDTPADLVEIGRDAERRALAAAVRWHAEHRVLLNGQRTIVFR